MDRPKLGQHITASAAAVQKKIHAIPDIDELPVKPNLEDINPVTWMSPPLTPEHDKQPYRVWCKQTQAVSGVYVGRRFVSDGFCWSARQTQNHEIWLIVVNERHNPIRVFPEDVPQFPGDVILPHDYTDIDRFIGNLKSSGSSGRDAINKVVSQYGCDELQARKWIASFIVNGTASKADSAFADLL